MTQVHGAAMIRPAGIGVSPQTTRARSPRSASGAFRVDAGPIASSGAATQATPSAEILGALLDLQGVVPGDGDRRRRIAAAQWALSLLDRLHMGLLEGAACDADIEALAGATAALRGTDLDDALHAALVEIEIRARVELAKRGR